MINEVELKKHIANSLAKNYKEKYYVRMSFSPRSMLPYYNNEVSFLEDYDEMKPIFALLDKYHIKFDLVDSVPGNFDLNRVYIETVAIPAVVEYSGVNPIGWDVDDIFQLYKLDNAGDVRIVVTVCDENGKYITMNG